MSCLAKKQCLKYTPIFTEIRSTVPCVCIAQSSLLILRRTSRIAVSELRSPEPEDIQPEWSRDFWASAGKRMIRSRSRPNSKNKLEIITAQLVFSKNIHGWRFMGNDQSRTVQMQHLTQTSSKSIEAISIINWAKRKSNYILFSPVTQLGWTYRLKKSGVKFFNNFFT